MTVQQVKKKSVSMQLCYCNISVKYDEGSSKHCLTLNLNL